MKKQMVAILLLGALAVSAAQATFAADVKPGAKCPVVNKTASSSGKVLQCALVNKKLIWVAKGATTSKSKSASAVGPQIQKITSTLGGNLSIVATPGVGAITSSSGLTVDVTSSTPDVCTYDSAGIHLLSTGKCTLTANQSGNTAFLAATFSQNIDITAPKLDKPDDQLSNAKQIFLVGKSQLYKAELFEFQILQVTDNADTAICADSASNQGCFLDSYGESKVDPKSAQRYVKIHVKLHDTGTELMGPTFYFRVLTGTKIYDAQISVTLPGMNDATLQPGQTAEGDYYISLPKEAMLDQAHLIFDDNFLSPDQAVIFAL